MRPLCKCGHRPAAINYKKQGKVYYRKLCEICLRHGEGHGIPKWKLRGYEKKNNCEKCVRNTPSFQTQSMPTTWTFKHNHAHGLYDVKCI